MYNKMHKEVVYWYPTSPNAIKYNGGRGCFALNLVGDDKILHQHFPFETSADAARHGKDVYPVQPWGEYSLFTKKMEATCF